MNIQIGRTLVEAGERKRQTDRQTDRQRERGKCVYLHLVAVSYIRVCRGLCRQVNPNAIRLRCKRKLYFMFTDRNNSTTTTTNWGTSNI